MLIKNKTAVGYFALIWIVPLVFYILTSIAYVSPLGSLEDDLDFGKSTKKVDLFYMQTVAEEFFLDSVLDGVLDNSKDKFPILISKSNINDFDNFDVSKHQGCIFESNLNLWYNQKNVDDFSDESLNCLPDLEGNISSKFADYVNLELEEILLMNNKVLDVESLSSVIYDDIQKKYFVEITTDFLYNGKVSNVDLNYVYKKDFEANDYLNLVSSFEKILPELSETLRKNIPKCILEKSNDNIENLEMVCMEISILDLIKNSVGGKEILEVYDINIDYFEVQNSKANGETNVVDVKKYFGLKFNIMNKKSQVLDLEFGVILQDNIPYNLINFNVNPYLGLDNVLKVTIDKPRFNGDDVERYIVMYSYDNFFSKDTYTKYDYLIELLQNRRIPNDFVNEGAPSLESGDYYHTTNDGGSSNLNLNFMLVSKNNFVQKTDGSEDVKRDILIYQIFDEESSGYELLESGKQVYVFVFAVDGDFNYYVDDLKGKTQEIKPLNQLGPIPISEANSQNVDITGKIDSQDKSLKIDIGKYVDAKFNDYQIYIKEESASFDMYCGQNENCYYYNSLDLNNETEHLIITSDENYVEEENYKIINTKDFNYVGVDSLILENGKSYDVMIVPVDISGTGYFETVLISEKISSIPTIYETTKSFYRIEPLLSNLRYEPFTKRITIEDNKPPIPEDIELLSLQPTGNNFVLSWSTTDDSVLALWSYISVFDVNGVLTHSGPSEISNDGVLRNTNIASVDYYSENFAGKVEISNIVPVDDKRKAVVLGLYDVKDYVGGKTISWVSS